MAAMTDPATRAAERLSFAYEAHRQALLRYAARRAGPEEAADVVSTVFSIAWSKVDQMPDDALPWLYRIAGFEVLKVGKRRMNAYRAASRLAVASTTFVVDDHELVVDALWVQQVIDSLRPNDAELLRLVVWEDLDIPRAAAVLGCTVAAAHVRLHRLRKRVEAQLRGLAAEDLRRESDTK